MANYTIYSTISLATDEKIREHLRELEKPISQIMNNAGFKLSAQNEGGLGLDYVINSDGYMGNIGFLFDDIQGSQTYTLYVGKAYDKEGYRYSVNEIILKNVELSILESNLKDLFQNALTIYTQWDKKDMARSVKLRSVKMMTKEDLEEVLKKENIKSYTAKDIGKFQEKKDGENPSI